MARKKSTTRKKATRKKRARGSSSTSPRDATPALVGAAELGTLLENPITKQAVCKHARNGMPHTKVRGAYRFDPVVCQRWIRQNVHTHCGGKRSGGGRPPADPKKKRESRATDASSDDELRASIEEDQDRSLTRTQADTRKLIYQGDVLLIDRNKQLGRLVDVDQIRAHLVARLKAASQHLDDSRHPVAMRIVNRLELPADTIELIMDALQDRDNEHLAMLRAAEPEAA